MGKRAFDLALGSLGLLAGLPVLLAVTVVILLADGTPVFFRQVRVGRSGADFRLIKFRTMVTQAGAEAGSFDVGSSDRVTRLGRILRTTKLDELPQLWNVLRGEMSLVGPRPEVRRWVNAYPDRWARVLVVRPGITDPASVEFRNEGRLLEGLSDPERTYREVILPRKLDLYDEYLRNWSLLGDLRILWQTFLAVTRVR